MIKSLNNYSILPSDSAYVILFALFLEQSAPPDSLLCFYQFATLAWIAWLIASGRKREPVERVEKRKPRA